MSLSIHTTTRNPKTPQPISLLLSAQTLAHCPNCQESLSEHHIDTHTSPHDGGIFLKMLEEKSPTVVLLDVFMPGLDALEVKKGYDKHHRESPVIFHATGPFYNDSIIKELMDNGFAYYFMKPFRAEALSRRIRNCVGGEAWNPEPDTDIQKVTLMLRELGMPSHLLGFNFVRQAIGLVLENPTRYGSGMVTLRLYPDIAAHNNTTSSRVERAIRHAIEVSFDRGNPETLMDYFGDSVGSSNGKTTNSEFIATVSDRIYIEGKGDNRTAITSKGWF